MGIAPNLPPGLPVPNDQWVLVTDSLTESVSITQMTDFFHEEGHYPISRTSASHFSKEGEADSTEPLCSVTSLGLELAEGI